MNALNRNNFNSPSAGSQVMVRTYAFAIQNWKQGAFESYFPKRRFIYVPFDCSEAELRRHWLPAIMQDEGAEVFVWSREIPDGILRELRAAGIRVTLIEDGFIRSAQAHASRTAPASLALDTQAPYFDARYSSDLEDLLATYDFSEDPDLMRRARAGIALLRERRLSKYNTLSRAPSRHLDRPKRNKRVMVIGQVEGDASIRFGCDRPIDNNDVVRLAAEENPDADIFYKPHPDVLNRVRPRQSDPRSVASICKLVSEPMPLADALETIDHVYTITSLAGFEALMRDIKVTTLGCPFYSGWGLTDDRQPNPRRSRKLSVEQVFAGAYLLYPLYFDVVSGAPQTFEDAVAQIERQLAAGEDAHRPAYAQKPEKARWAPIGPYGLLGWRHLLPFVVAPIITRVGNKLDTIAYREDPIVFFRELKDPKFRAFGRLLYPFDDERTRQRRQEIAVNRQQDGAER